MSFTKVSAFIRSEDGPTAVEYAVMVALVLLAIIGTINVLGGAANGIWGNNVSSIRNINSGS